MIWTIIADSVKGLKWGPNEGKVGFIIVQIPTVGTGMLYKRAIQRDHVCISGLCISLAEAVDSGAALLFIAVLLRAQTPDQKASNHWGDC